MSKVSQTFYVSLIVFAMMAVFAIIKQKEVVDNFASQVKDLEQQVTNLKSQEELDLVLGQYAINMMYKTRAATKISDARKQILARSLVKVTNDVFTELDHKKAFIAVVAIESEFERTAQSPTGPKGLSQVAKAAFAEGMANCGVDGIRDEDVWETDLNLYAGACYFRSVMERNNNDPYISIVAYNQGPNSKDIKTYSKSGHLETLEALKYVARFTFLKRTTKEEKAPNAPAMESNVAKPSKVESIDGIKKKNKPTPHSK